MQTETMFNLVKDKNVRKDSDKSDERSRKRCKYSTEDTYKCVNNGKYMRLTVVSYD